MDSTKIELFVGTIVHLVTANMGVNIVNGEETNLATNMTPANKEDSLLKG